MRGKIFPVSGWLPAFTAVWLFAAFHAGRQKTEHIDVGLLYALLHLQYSFHRFLDSGAESLPGYGSRSCEPFPAETGKVILPSYRKEPSEETEFPLRNV